jgi:hypothetical protein
MRIGFGVLTGISENLMSQLRAKLPTMKLEPIELVALGLAVAGLVIMAYFAYQLIG